MPAVFAVLFAALCFGTTGTSQALAGVDASPFAIGAARILIGGGILSVVALVIGTKGEDQRPSIRLDSQSVSGPAAWAIVIIGALGVLAYQPMFFAGASLSGVALGTVVGIGSAPVFTGLLDSLLHQRLPSPRWCLTTALALVGVLLATNILTGGTSERVNLIGVLAALGAGASYAVYTLASKRLIDCGWGSTRAMGALFGVAAMMSLPILLVADFTWLATPHGLALTLWLGVVTVAIAYLLYGKGLRSLGANTVATLTLAEPLTAALLGILVLDETLSPTSWIGLVVLGVALALLSLPVRKQHVTQTA